MFTFLHTEVSIQEIVFYVKNYLVTILGIVALANILDER